MIAFTPWYASPEQVLGEPMATATDIYSLGRAALRAADRARAVPAGDLAPLEVMRAIVEQEPEPPSVAIDRTVRIASAEGGPAPPLTPWSVSRTREGTPERLRPRLRGDLDAILMTALRKEPERRYPSVEPRSPRTSAPTSRAGR